MKNSWIAYDQFLQKYGSHLVRKVFYGSRINEYIFTQHSKECDEHDYEIKICEKFEGLAHIGKLGIFLCQNFTRKDAEKVEHMHVTHKLILKGGTDKTRSALHRQRTKELIEKFLEEAGEVRSPVKYIYMPIWTLLKDRYLHDNHEDLAKAVNLESYYKRYLNFGCPLQKINDLVVQKFQSISGYPLPAYKCEVTPKGCHNDDDCHRWWRIWCQCRGDTCIKYNEKFDYNTLSTRIVPYAFTDSG